MAEFVAASPWGRFASVFDDDAGDRLVSEEVLLRRLADAEGLMAQLAAAQGRVLLELRGRRLATQQQAAPDGHLPGSCTRGCCDPDPHPSDSRRATIPTCARRGGRVGL